MLKHSLPLAVLVLLVMAGGVLVWVQVRQSAPLHPSRPAATADPAAVCPALRPSATETSPPPAAAVTARAAAAAASPPAAATGPAPDTFFLQPASRDSPTALGTLAEGRPDPAAPLLPDIGKPWTESIFSEPDRAGGGRVPDLFNRNPDGDRPPSLGGLGLGPQLPLLKTDDTTFQGRLACGHSPQDSSVPGGGERITEVLLGCQLEHHLSRRNRVFGEADYACDPADFARRQVRTQAAWEVLLDPEENLSLRTTLLESSSSAPNREQAKSLNYSLNLMWKF